MKFPMDTFNDFTSSMPELSHFRYRFESFKDFVKTAKTLSNEMAANYDRKKHEFEFQTTSYKKTGSIDLNRIARYKTSDDIFTAKAIIGEGKSHALVCPIDFSMSMINQLGEVAMQFLITALFCKKIDCKFIFYTFTSPRSVDECDAKRCVKSSKYFTNGDHGCTFKVLADDSNSEADIIDTYFRMFILHAYRDSSFRPTPALEPYVQWVTQNYSMEFTPLVSANFKAYTIAQYYKSLGITNVSIFTISDGENTDKLDCNIKENSHYLANQIKDPYSNRLYNIKYSINNVYNRSALQSPINRMIRDQGHKIFLIYITSGQFKTFTFTSLCNSHDNYNEMDQLKRRASDVCQAIRSKKSYASIDNMVYYNKFIFINKKAFPIVSIHNSINNTNKKVSKQKMLKDKITKANNNKKALETIAQMISDVFVADFDVV